MTFHFRFFSNKPAQLGFTFFLLTAGGCISDQTNNSIELEAPSSETELFTEQKSSAIDEYTETFSAIQLPKSEWQMDTYPDDGPFSDNGQYFQSKGITPPTGYRSHFVFGANGWLTAELYSRDGDRSIDNMISIVKDPQNDGNSVLRISSPEHTDAVIIRSSEPLPAEYRISLRVGFPDFGTGHYPNGYDSGDEQASPWISETSNIGSAVGENGFYWLAILDRRPRPHNNIWIHHHRKFVIDSDNNFPAWTNIYNGETYIRSGENPISVFALDGMGEPHIHNGSPFIMYANEAWQPSGKIRAIDAYKPEHWYDVTFSRTGTEYQFTISGHFKFGGERTYKGSIDFREHCLYHYNQTPEEQTDQCSNLGFFSELGQSTAHWPSHSAYPDYLFFGDPHINFYEGSVLYDDIRLEIIN